MAIDDLFNSVPTQPKVWVEELALFESIDVRPFREVFLKPGLNIIWAKEGGSANKKGEYQLGHGVGKTSLCRLLRYCLGEKHYAPCRLREQVIETYPRGYVAVKVWIDGEMWVVAKPLGLQKKVLFCQEW